MKGSLWAPKRLDQGEPRSGFALNELLGATDRRANESPVRLPKKLPDASVLQRLRAGNWTRLAIRLRPGYERKLRHADPPTWPKLRHGARWVPSAVAKEPSEAREGATATDATKKFS